MTVARLRLARTGGTAGSPRAPPTPDGLAPQQRLGAPPAMSVAAANSLPQQQQLGLSGVPGEAHRVEPRLGPLEQETLSYRWTHPDPRMDRLQAETAEAVARAVERGEEAPAIFDRVRALAAAAAGAAPPAPVAGGMGKGRKRPPRLTEAWFC